MLNQQQLIEAARVAIAKREGRAEPVTHYRVSKELGITSAYMSAMREGRYIMSAQMAHKCAQLAEIDPAYAMACIEAERAARDELETTGTWRAIADALASRAAAVVGVVIMAAMLAHSPPAAASTYTRDALGVTRAVYTLCEVGRRLLSAVIHAGMRFLSQRRNCLSLASCGT